MNKRHHVRQILAGVEASCGLVGEESPRGGSQASGNHIWNRSREAWPGGLSGITLGILCLHDDVIGYSCLRKRPVATDRAHPPE
jgi:hypothetical protein